MGAQDSGVQVAELISSELAYNETRAIEIAMQSTLADRALILAPDGTTFMGELSSDARARALNIPLEHNGEALGTLLYLPSSTFQPPLPYWIAVLICIAITALASVIMGFFARTVVGYVGQVTRLIGDYSLVGTSRRRVSKFAFAEFRQLALATTRATRRVAKELEHLRATARLDERTGLLNEPAFHQEVKEALQTLTSASQAVLITIEFQAQNANSDGPIQLLSNEAYIEAAQSPARVCRTSRH